MTVLGNFKWHQYQVSLPVISAPWLAARGWPGASLAEHQRLLRPRDSGRWQYPRPAQLPSLAPAGHMDALVSACGSSVAWGACLETQQRGHQGVSVGDQSWQVLARICGHFPLLGCKGNTCRYQWPGHSADMATAQSQREHASIHKS